MDARRGRFGVMAWVAAAGLAGCSLVGGGAGSQTSPDAGPVAPAAASGDSSATVVVLDGSGTMVKTDVAPSRLAAAKTAATDLVGSLPPESSIGVLAFGQSTGNADADKPRGCQDVTTLVASGTGETNRSRAVAAIGRLTASGYTPLGLALTKAVEQLPDGAGSVVLVTDGEDTCAPPEPCETARQLKQSHPGLTISVVGMRLEGGASEQLACLAEAGDGLFVTADSTEQLKTRLQATRDVERAKESLTSNGVGSIHLAQSHEQIRERESEFPGWDQARAWGDDEGSGGVRPYQGGQVQSQGTAQDLMVIVWRDCWYVFDGQRRLVAVLARNGTVDAVTSGDPASKAAGVYGQPVASQPNTDGTYSVTYAADRAAGTAYQMVLTGDPADPATTIKTIVLCRCLPSTAVATPTETPSSVESSAASSTGQGIELSRTKIGSVTVPAPVTSVRSALVAQFGREPDEDRSYSGCAAEVAGPEYAITRVISWGDFTIHGDGRTKDSLDITGWSVSGTNLPVPMTTKHGFHLGEDIQSLARTTGGVYDETFNSVGVGDGEMLWYGDETDKVTSAGTIRGCD